MQIQGVSGITTEIRLVANILHHYDWKHCEHVLMSVHSFTTLAANVRTYVRLKSRPELTGIYFFSLDCSSALVTLGARAAFSLPYKLSTMAHSVTAVPCGDGDGADARSGLTQHKFNAVRCRSRWCRRHSAAAATYADNTDVAMIIMTETAKIMIRKMTTPQTLPTSLIP